MAGLQQRIHELEEALTAAEEAKRSLDAQLQTIQQQLEVS